MDGDTIIVGKHNIRLVYIDAPELGQMSVEKAPIGRLSKEFLESLILGKLVHIKYYKRDKYGRILGEVFFQKKDINLMMVKKGHSFPYGWTYPARYQTAYYKAKLKHLGMFRYDDFKLPWIYRKEKKRGRAKKRPLKK